MSVRKAIMVIVVVVCLELGACMIRCGLAVCLPGKGKDPSASASVVGSYPENKTQRFVRRMNGHLNRFGQRVKAGWQDVLGKPGLD